MKRWLFGLALLLGSAAPVSAHEGAHHGDHRPSDGGEFAGRRLQLADVTLVDQNGRQQPYPWGVAEHGLLVMTFGYTSCESFCPLGNAVMAQLQNALAADIPHKVRLVTVSIDPQTDTPEVLRKTAARFGAHDDWLWLTGDTAAVDRLLRSAAVKTRDPAQHDPVFLVGDPRSGRFYRSQSMPSAAELLKVVRSFTQ